MTHVSAAPKLQRGKTAGTRFRVDGSVNSASDFPRPRSFFRDGCGKHGAKSRRNRGRIASSLAGAGVNGITLAQVKLVQPLGLCVG